MRYESSDLIVQKEILKESDFYVSFQECPLCKKKIQIKVQFKDLEQEYSEKDGIIPHIVLHGKPLHALLCYVDKHMAVRGKGYIKSIGILRDTSTYHEFIQLWSSSNLEYIDK